MDTTRYKVILSSNYALTCVRETILRSECVREGIPRRWIPDKLAGFTRHRHSTSQLQTLGAMSPNELALCLVKGLYGVEQTRCLRAKGLRETYDGADFV